MAAPVVGAFAVGTAVGVGLEKGLDVSKYGSSYGTWTYEKLKGAGANDTASLVTGGVVTVLGTPVALTHATVAKGAEVAGKGYALVKSWF